MKYIALIISALLISFLLGIRYERETHQGEIHTSYNPLDIIFTDLYNLQVTFEMCDSIYNFTDRQQALDFAESMSAQLTHEGMKEYQIQLDFDTVRVYKYGRYIDCYIVGDTLSPLDEILSLHNR